MKKQQTVSFSSCEAVYRVPATFNLEAVLFRCQGFLKNEGRNIGIQSH